MDRFATFLLFCTSLDLQPVCIDTQITRPTTSIGSRLEIIGLPGTGSSCQVGSICLVRVPMPPFEFPGAVITPTTLPGRALVCLCCASNIEFFGHERVCACRWFNLFLSTFCCYSKMFLNDKNPIMLLFVCMTHSITCL